MHFHASNFLLDLLCIEKFLPRFVGQITRCISSGTFLKESLSFPFGNRISNCVHQQL